MLIFTEQLIYNVLSFRAKRTGFKRKVNKIRAYVLLCLFTLLLLTPIATVSISASDETPEEINKILRSGAGWVHYPVLSVRDDPSVPGRITYNEVKWIAETRQLWLNVTADVSGTIVTTVFIDLPAFDEPPEEISQIINGKPTSVPYRVYKCNETIVKKLVIDVLRKEEYEDYVANGWDRYYAARGWDKTRYEAYGLDEYYTPVDPQARERDKNNISAAFVWEENYIAHGWDKPGAYVWYRSYYLYSWNPITAGEWKNPLEDLPANACRCVQCMDSYMPEFDYAKPFWVISMNITYSSMATILVSQHPITETEPPTTPPTEPPPDETTGLDPTPFIIAVPIVLAIILGAVFYRRSAKEKSQQSGIESLRLRSVTALKG